MHCPTTRRAFLLGPAGFALLRAAEPGAFRALEVNHVALRVSNLARSEEFYRTRFGAPGIIFEKPGQRYMRMGKNFVALFQKEEPAMDHFAISIEGYDPDAVEAKTRSMGLETRRSSSFVYVHDPDGIEVQITHAEHEMASPVVRKAPASSTFAATGVNHVALSVSEVARSRRFYQRLFGLPLISESTNNCFLGINRNFLALFRGRPTGLNHFCLSIEDYNPDKAVATLKDQGLRPERRSNRVYFPDPDGLTVQIAAGSHQP